MRGLLSIVPTIFGLPAASVQHHECESDGYPACIYRRDLGPPSARLVPPHAGTPAPRPGAAGPAQPAAHPAVGRHRPGRQRGPRHACCPQIVGPRGRGGARPRLPARGVRAPGRPHRSCTAPACLTPSACPAWPPTLLGGGDLGPQRRRRRRRLRPPAPRPARGRLPAGRRRPRRRALDARRPTPATRPPPSTCSWPVEDARRRPTAPARCWRWPTSWPRAADAEAVCRGRRRGAARRRRLQPRQRSCSGTRRRASSARAPPSAWTHERDPDPA